MKGISADANGNYAFNFHEGVEKINLIEIEVPDSLDEKIEDEITKIAFAIAAEYLWCVFDNETSLEIYL